MGARAFAGWILSIVSFDQCWPGIVADLAALGITVTKGAGVVNFSYTHLPEINIAVEDYWSGYPFKRGRFDRAHNTPYQEEVIALRLIALLPQPIAEAITDCILAVGERRFKERYSPALCYTTEEAVRMELIYTKGTYFARAEVYSHEMVDKRHWEAAQRTDYSSDSDSTDSNDWE